MSWSNFVCSYAVRVAALDGVGIWTARKINIFGPRGFALQDLTYVYTYKGVQNTKQTL